MPVYEYTALNNKGKTIAGIIDAESSFVARQKLRATKQFPVSIKEVQETAEKKESWQQSIFRSFARIRQSEVSIMTRQLSTLISAGFPLVTAIDSMIPQTKSTAFKRVLAHIKDSIVEGNSFAASLSQYPEIFPPLFTNLVAAGESSGTLEIVLERLADIMEKQQALYSRIKAALAYPILMMLIGSAVLFFLMTYIVPSISSIFIEMDQVLPTPTQFLIKASNIMKSYWWVLLILGIMLYVAFRNFKKTTTGRYYNDKIVLSFPIVGILIKKLAVARFARTLGSLLENGVSMLTALEIVKNIVGNIHLSDTIVDAAKEVGKGKALGAAISESDVFPNLAVQMIQIGEQSGELEKMLNKVADIFEREVESSVLSMTSLLEPIMILVMAVFVGFVVISICLPIFEMNQLIK